MKFRASEVNDHTKEVSMWDSVDKILLGEAFDKSWNSHLYCKEDD